MIKLRGKAGVEDKTNKIIFTPRPGFDKGYKAALTLEYPLLYGHRCIFCGNVMQALFKAPKTFSLWPYEETTLLSQGEKNSGEIRRVFPDEKTKSGRSCYRMDYSPAEGGSIKLVLKNHIMRNQAIVERQFNGEGLWEVGERACTHAGIFSIREDLLVKDFLLFSRMDEYEIQKYELPKITNFIKEDNPNFKLVPAIGQAPPVALVERQSYVYGWNYQVRDLLKPFIKKGL